MPRAFGDINSPYISYDNLDDINPRYEDATFGVGTGLDAAVPLVGSDTMDEGYAPAEEGEASSQGGMFSGILGPGADIYNSQSIANALMAKYGVEGLTAGMFPAMSKSLMAATQASTYDPFKSLLTNPETRQYAKMIAQSAGMLNPNKRRKRAMRAYKAGLGDIKSGIFDKTSTAREGVKDWLNNALAKVKRMKY